MQSDDLFLRKMRGPSARPPPSPAPPGGVPSPPSSPGPPTSPRFRDPLLLLGLEGAESAEGGRGDTPQAGGDPADFPRPPWSPLLAHYDVQSILFDPAEPPPAPPAPTSGASAAHLDPPQGDGGEIGGPPPDPEALVLSCPRFCCETGGEREPGLGLCPRGGPAHLPPAAVAVLEEPPAGGRPPHPIEHSDAGADYYRKFFYGKEHQNFLGEDARLGPVAVSLRREDKDGGGHALLRLILRCSQLRTLRASVLEEALPAGGRGGPPKKLLELLLPGLGVGALRPAGPSPAVPDTLLKLDEQGLCFQRKVGVLYCRGGQGSEEEMYNNRGAGPPFTRFLGLLGTRVRLRGFPHYRAQLDTRTDSTGTHSLYTRYHGYEVMFHVSTMLPFTPHNPQQLLRKRHIGNDIVTIVFQEEGARPFSPRALRSHFQHVFIVVRERPPRDYRVAVVRPEDTPPFGPPLPRGSLFRGGAGLREFLLAKAINGENAAARGGRLGAMAARTRRQYLQELLGAHGTGPPLANPPRGLGALGGGGRRRAGGGGGGGGAVVAGALVWGARVETGGPGWGDTHVGCLVGVAAERVVVVSPRGGDTMFSCACRDVLGWSFGEGRLELFYGAGGRLGLRLPPGAAPQLVGRLQAVTRGCEARELALPRGPAGARGFRVDAAGVVTSVARFSFAETAGLRPGARLLRANGRPLAGLGRHRLRRLLRDPPKIRLTVLPPERDGRPRRSFSELYALSLEQGHGGGGDTGGDIGDSSDSGDTGDSDDGAGGDPGGLRPETLQLLRSLALAQESPPEPPGGDPQTHPDPPSPDPRQPLADPTPDLLLPHRPPPAGPPPDAGVPVSPPEPGPPLALRQSLGRLLSGTGDLDHEWDTIARLASACSAVLEALARGGDVPRDPPGNGETPSTPDQSQGLSEKVAQLEAALKRLQEDLQEGQEAQQRLQAELRTLRRSNRRLQQEQEDAAARLSRVTRLLGTPPGPPPGTQGPPETPPGSPGAAGTP